MRTVLDVWTERSAVLGNRSGIEQVYCFVNAGAEIGVTLSHPHGQIYGFPFITPRTDLMLRHLEHLGEHPFIELLRADAVRVHRGMHWTVAVPTAARWPVHVLVVPHRRVADLGGLNEAERREFPGVLTDLLRRLDRLYDRPLPYVAAWHQAPVRRGRQLCWLHLEVFSIRRAADRLKYLAGVESGMAVWISDTTPERIATRLRNA